MKKLVLLAAFTIGAAFFSNMNAQQISDNALGLRIGGGNDFGAEVTYQKAIGGNNNRLEFDLGWGSGSHKSKDYDIFKLTGLYQWVWNIEGGFNWYVGAGGGIGNYDDNDFDDADDDGIYPFLAGDIGIEYNFDFPLLLSLDFRPEIEFSNYLDKDLNSGIALGIKYQF